MARRVSAALASLCLLPKCGALRRDSPAAAQVDASNDLSCVCLNWADVYATRGVECGQGMELFFMLRNLNTTVHKDDHSTLSIAKLDKTASALVDGTLKKSSVYQEFCSNFFMKANFNFCMAKHFQATAEEVKHHHSPSRGSWCYVDAKCQLPTITRIPGTNVAAKRCAVGGLDLSLGDMLLEDAAKVGVNNKLDQGLIAGHAYVHKDMLVSEVTPDVLKELQFHKDQTTLIWSMRDHFAPRWVVRGRQIWEHTMDFSTGKWIVKCKRECVH